MAVDLAQPRRRGCLIGNAAVELAGHDVDIAQKIRKMQDESIGWFTASVPEAPVVVNVRF